MKPRPTATRPITNLPGLVGSGAACSHPQPQPGEHRRQREDEERVDALEPAARERQAEHLGAGVAIGEEVERRAGLLEHRPEERRGEEQHADHVEAPPFRRRPVAGEEQPGEEHHGAEQQDHAGGVGDSHGGDRQGAGERAEAERRSGRRGTGRPRASPGAPRWPVSAGVAAGCKPASPSRVRDVSGVLDDAEGHADAGRGEAGVPADPLAQVAADQRGQERPEVDPHVEDREAGVAPSDPLAP